jgi:hypothetical protein
MRQLRYFADIHEAGRLLKASTGLHVAQPALGQQIWRHWLQTTGDTPALPWRLQHVRAPVLDRSLDAVQRCHLGHDVPLESTQHLAACPWRIGQADWRKQSTQAPRLCSSRYWPRGQAGPMPEDAMEGADLGEPQQPGDFGHRKLRPGQMLDGGIAPLASRGARNPWPSRARWRGAPAWRTAAGSPSPTTKTAAPGRCRPAPAGHRLPGRGDARPAAVDRSGRCGWWAGRRQHSSAAGPC